MIYYVACIEPFSQNDNGFFVVKPGTQLSLPGAGVEFFLHPKFKLTSNWCGK